MTVRVRFAPSPTGTLHLGSARSALYNWLYARHHGDDGVYVLRIEDTDVERSTAENVQQALRVFRWLGLDWDEGPDVGGPYAPYFQSERGHLYRAALDQLLEAEHAYECFCTKEQLDAERARAQADKRPFVYGGTCRALSRDECARRAAAGEPFVIRFRISDGGTTVVDDVILGESSFENDLIGDFVIARSDGTPLYNFANVVDDAHMRITHVVRGSDHLSNTPKQIMLYEVLGYGIPRFAHVPMILDPEGGKLSKRKQHAATIEQLAEAGYVPEAVRNGLALVGWSRDGETTVMSTSEMVEAFELARVKKSPAAIDYDKLRHINGQHLRALPAADWADAYDAWRNFWLSEHDPLRDAAFAVTPEQAALLVQEKVDTLGEVPDYVGFMGEPHEIADEAWQRLLKVDEAPQVLDRVLSALEQLDSFDVGDVERALRGTCEAMELKPRVVFGPVRFAITGRTVSPGLFESISVLGRERALSRLREARTRLASLIV